MPGEQIPTLFVWLQPERPESTGSNEIQAAPRPNPAGGQRDKGRRSRGEPHNKRSCTRWLQTSPPRAASEALLILECWVSTPTLIRTGKDPHRPAPPTCCRCAPVAALRVTKLWVLKQLNLGILGSAAWLEVQPGSTRMRRALIPSGPKSEAGTRTVRSHFLTVAA